MITAQDMARDLVTLYAQEMPLGGLSPLVAANAARYPENYATGPLAPARYAPVQCVLNALAQMVQYSMQEMGGVSGYRPEYLRAMAPQVEIPVSELGVPRLSGMGHPRMLLSSVRNVAEVSATISSYQDATQLYTRLLAKAVLPVGSESEGGAVGAGVVADTLRSAVVQYGAQGATQEAMGTAGARLLQISEEILGACSSRTEEDMVASVQDMSLAAASAAVGSPDNAYDMPTGLQDVVGSQAYAWGSFVRKPPGQGLRVELVDKDDNLRYIVRPDGGFLRGMLMNISPESLTINSVKIVNRYQTLSSWVEEHWGDELDQVSFSGKTLGFVTQQPSGAVQYLAVDSRRYSSAYTEIRDMVAMYQANGLVIQGPGVGRDTDTPSVPREFYSPTSRTPVRKILSHPRTGLVKERFYVRLTFDFFVCTGFFESFELVEDVSSPYQFNYSVNFRSEMTTYL